MSSLEKVVDLIAAAERLRLPYHTVHRMVLVGQLEGSRKAGRWHVSATSLERLVRERTPAPVVDR